MTGGRHTPGRNSPECHHHVMIPSQKISLKTQQTNHKSLDIPATYQTFPKYKLVHTLWHLQSFCTGEHIPSQSGTPCYHLPGKCTGLCKTTTNPNLLQALASYLNRPSNSDSGCDLAHCWQNRHKMPPSSNDEDLKCSSHIRCCRHK